MKSNKLDFVNLRKPQEIIKFIALGEAYASELYLSGAFEKYKYEKLAWKNAECFFIKDLLLLNLLFIINIKFLLFTKLYKNEVTQLCHHLLNIILYLNILLIKI